jgi:hypothetical protein
VRVTATSAQLNKETQIRTNQIIFGMVMQFYGQMLQAMQVAFSPDPMIPQQMRELALQMFTGGTVLARRILDEYDIQDADRIIPDFGAPQNGIGQPGFMGAPAQFGGAPVSQGPPSPPRLLPAGPGLGGAYAAGPPGFPQQQGYMGNSQYAG